MVHQGVRRHSPFVRVVIEDSGTVVRPAVILSGVANDVQPTADTSKVNGDESAIVTGSTVTGNATRGLL